MQGLARYHGDSPPSSPPIIQESGPSRETRNNGEPVMDSAAIPRIDASDPKGKTESTTTTAPPSRDRSPRKRKTVNYSDFAPLEAPGPSRSRSPPLTATSAQVQSSDRFAGMTEEEIFRRVTRPDEIEGVADWGIPPEVDPSTADDALKAKVEHFLRLKYERGQHINSTLLTSSSFANPHIYAKLVEFVDIDETATAFPSDGWMTRRGIEDLMPDYGPKALAATQKARQEAIKRTQEVGKRSNIQFAPARRREGDDRDGTSESGRKRGRQDEYRDRETYRPKDRRHEADRRDRERDRGGERRDRR